MSKVSDNAEEFWLERVASSEHRYDEADKTIAALIDEVRRLEGEPRATTDWLDKAEAQFERLSKHLSFHIKRNHVYPVMTDDPKAQVDTLVFDMLRTAQELIGQVRVQNLLLEAPLLMPSGDLLRRITAETSLQRTKPVMIPDMKLLALLEEAAQEITRLITSGQFPPEVYSVLAGISLILASQSAGLTPALPAGVIEVLEEASECLEKWKPSTPEAREANFWRRMGWIYSLSNMRLEDWLTENDMPAHLNQEERSWMREGREARASGMVMPEEWKHD